MAQLALKISIKHSGATKTMQFDPACTVYDACRMIREKNPEAQKGQGLIEFHCYTLEYEIKAVNNSISIPTLYPRI